MKQEGIELTTENLIKIISAQRTATVNILKAPPGSGKSHTMRKAIATLIQSSVGVQRVLWCTHSTHTKDGKLSIGEEAEKAFRSLGVNVQLVHGREYFNAKDTKAHKVKKEKKITYQEQYKLQFDWPEEGQVKIISYAHLPLLYGRITKQSNIFSLKSVDLLVIDEDPIQNLIDNSINYKRKNLLNHSYLSKQEDAISKSICYVLARARSGKIICQQYHINNSTKVKCEITGIILMKELVDALNFFKVGKKDWENFQKNCQLPTYIIDALKEDLANTNIGSQRFYITWQIDKDKEIPSLNNFQLDYSVLMSLGKFPKTFILDAYGELDYYRAVFSKNEINFLDLYDKSLGETGEYIDAIYFRELNLSRGITKTNKGLRTLINTNKILRQIIIFTKSQVPQKSVILVYKNMIPWLRLQAKTLCHEYDLPEDAIVFQHWFSGRGSNAFEGRHLFALTEPHRPRNFRDHTLAALYPYDSLKREETARHLAMTEVLQMLHRNRQIQIRKFKKTSPSVIVTFTPRYGVHLLHSSDFTKYLPEGETLKDKERLVYIISLELIGLLKALPTLALMAIGIMETPYTYVHAVSHIRGKMLKWLRISNYPYLKEWQDSKDPEYFKKALNGHLLRSDYNNWLEKLLKEKLEQLGYSRLKPNEIFLDPKRKLSARVDHPSRLVVWSKTPTDGNNALWKLLK